MTTSSINQPKRQQISVFMIGNNPVDISDIYDRLKKSKKFKFITDVAFDIREFFGRIITFHPSFILLDDNLGKTQIKQIVHKLIGDERTKNIPVTIVKNSNYSEIITEGVQDYILKDTVNEDSLYRSLANSRKLRKTQLYLYKTYKKNKGKLMDLLSAE